MAEPNSDNVVSTPSVNSNNYDATDEAPLASWSKLPEGAAGWNDSASTRFPDSGAWKQV